MNIHNTRKIDSHLQAELALAFYPRQHIDMCL